MSFLVSPSILSADFANLEREINSVLEAGADWIHVDVMDGHFVPNLTIGAPVVKSLRKITKAPLDCHLMIETPEKYVKDFAEAGADYITIHVEASKDPVALLKQIRELGCKAGITLRPATSVDLVLPYLDLVDLVLVMTVDPGFSGQKFMTDQIEKMSIIRKKLTKLGSKALIEVDGGVNAETVEHCKDADVLVAGNFVFKSKSYREAIQTLKGQS
jgi:ribulose-phosphate 3-epimerase